MKSMRTVLAALVAGSLLCSAACYREPAEPAEPEEMTLEDYLANKEGFAYPQGPEPGAYNVVFYNDVDFVYDPDSTLEFDKIRDIWNITSLNNTYPITAIRQNEGYFYTVYSLQGGGLAYVVFVRIQPTGFGMFIYNVIEYPFQDSADEEFLWFLLPQDRPEAILELNQPPAGIPWEEQVSEIKSLVEDDLHIYFISTGGIMRHDKASGADTLLVEGGSIKSFRVYQDGIYYLDGKDSIFKADLDGGGSKQVFAAWQATQVIGRRYDVIAFEVFGDFIYVRLDGATWVRSSLLTQQVERFVVDVLGDCAFVGGSFLYIDHGNKTFSIYEKDLETGEVTLLRGDGISKRYLPQEESKAMLHIDGVFAVDGSVYYTKMSPAGVCRLDPGGCDQLIDGFAGVGEADYLNTSSGFGKLYYYLTYGPLERVLFEYDPATGIIRELVHIPDINTAAYFKVAGGFVFYVTPDGWGIHFVSI